ncbi:hypothetical protein B0J14DRAFT_46068 [Halenospora varia]|nr:hypothetical protein B0J14DRAFT_46068 [Halenospora varia]
MPPQNQSSRHSGSVPTPVFFDRGRRQQVRSDAQRSALVEATINRLRGPSPVKYSRGSSAPTPSTRARGNRVACGVLACGGAEQQNSGYLRRTPPLLSASSRPSYTLTDSEQFLSAVQPVQPNLPVARQPLTAQGASALNTVVTAASIGGEKLASVSTFKHTPPAPISSIGTHPASNLTNVKPAANKPSHSEAHKPSVGLSGSRWAIPSQSTNTTTQSLPSRELGSADTSIPERKEIASKTIQDNAEESQKQDWTVTLPKVGLSGSKWATGAQSSSPSVASGASGHGLRRVSVTASNSPVPTRICSYNIPPLRQVRWTFTTKVQKNGGDIIPRAFVRVCKTGNSSPRVVQIGVDSDQIFEGPIPKDSNLTIEHSNVTFGKNDPPAWKITFQLPSYARNFYDKIVEDEFRPSQTLESKVAENSSLIEQPISTPQSVMTNGPVDSNNADLRSLMTEPQPLGKDYFAAAPPAITTPNTPGFQNVSQYSERISSQTLNDLQLIEGTEALINLGEDEEPLEDGTPTAPSALHDLASLNDDYTICGFYEAIDVYYGSFLDEIASEVGRSLNEPSSKLLADEKCIAVAGELLQKFLNHSEIFAHLTKEEEDSYIKSTASMIFAKALFARDNGAEIAIPAETTTPTEMTTLVKMATTVEPVPEDPHVPQCVRGPYYSNQELFALRGNAVLIERVLLTKEEMLPKGHRPRNVIVSPTFKPATTVQGWQSYAEKEETGQVQANKEVQPELLLLLPSQSICCRLLPLSKIHTKALKSKLKHSH